jgi:predicted dehydrogenase
MISFCQFGAGRIDTIHAANIARQPEARLEAIVDVDLSRPRGGRAVNGAAVVAECGVPLMLGLNRRFDPHFARLERQLREQRLGRIELLGITSRDPEPTATRRCRARIAANETGGHAVTYSAITSRKEQTRWSSRRTKVRLRATPRPQG